jgi:hypothetical protein
VRPYLENTQHKKSAGGVAQSVGPEFKPLYCKKKKKEREREKKNVRQESHKQLDACNSGTLRG